jgi:bacterioferritin
MENAKFADLLNLLNQAIARELQVSIQYMFQHSLGGGREPPGSRKTPGGRRHNFVATKWPYFMPGDSLKKVAITEMRHAEAIAERVVHLGGEPTTEPAPITLGGTVEEMLELDREQERGAIQLYGQIIQVAGQAGDDTTKGLFQHILADEENHHKLFADLLETDGSL